MTKRIFPIFLDDGGGIHPTGTLNVTENGLIDVSQYAYVDVQILYEPEISNIQTSSTFDTISISFDIDSYYPILSEGVYYSTSPNIDPETAVFVVSTNGEAQITGLNSETTYYILPFASNSDGIGYGTEESVTTQSINYLTFTAEEPNTVVKFIKNGTSSTNNPHIDYSVDKSNWTSYDFSIAPDITLSNIGDKVYLRGSGNNGDHTRLSISTSNYTSVSVTSGKISASGDINTLLNGVGGDIALSQYAFCAFFKNCNVTQTPELPSTTLASNCYREMFSGSGITSIPSDLLPATTLAQSCYREMFSGSGITSIPSDLLPATTLANYCYYGMFSGTAITSIPSDLLPATTLANSCYYGMFSGTAITSIPSDLLPATTLANYCYYGMFSGTAITSIPSDLLPATTLAAYCYYGMFSGTAITSIPSDLLPATTLANYCYYGMFSGTAITSIPSDLLPATTLIQSCYREMFSGTAITSIPSDLLPATTLANNCYQNMFSGTAITSIPSDLLPATTLIQSCYREMFSGTAITSIPSGLLPATTLAASCYQNMFANCVNLTSVTIDAVITNINFINSMNGMFSSCSSLNSITINVTNWTANRATNWLSGVAATGDFYNLSGATIPTGTNGIPTGWTEHKGTIKIKWYDDNQMKYTLPSEWDSSNNSKVVGIAVQDNDKNISYTVAAKWARTDTPDTGGVNGNSMVYGDNTVSVSSVTTTTTYATAISDYNGKANTTALLANATAQPNWRTDSTITSSAGAGYQPAACCCWRFSSLGTNQGDWYLPAAGELNSSYDFRTPINNALLTCSSPILWDADGTTNRRWASTQGSAVNAWQFESGQMTNLSKNRDIRVRPFGDY